MPANKFRIGRETFRFFRDLGRNNNTEWMSKNRERYRAELVTPLRELLEELTPAVHKLYPGFDVCGRTGINFSRINRDIRFAKDKTPYHERMYVRFPGRGGKKRKAGELYLGFHARAVTAGFRAYFDMKGKGAALPSLIAALPKWSAGQKKRLGRKYESYWHLMEKGKWTKREGWPATAEEWTRLRAWIVRRTMKPGDATRADFPREAAKTFRDLLPLFEFVSLRS